MLFCVEQQLGRVLLNAATRLSHYYSNRSYNDTERERNYIIRKMIEININISVFHIKKEAI